jgi:GNAT superfamily N-acetyltransferase
MAESFSGIGIKDAIAQRLAVTNETIRDRYGIAFNFVQDGTGMTDEVHAVAFHQAGRLSMVPRQINNERSLARGQRDGWYAVGTPEGILAHEAGHYIGSNGARAQDAQLRANVAARQLFPSNEAFRAAMNDLSGYSASAPSERMPEIFAAHLLMPEDQKPEWLKTWGDTFDREYGANLPENRDDQGPSTPAAEQTPQPEEAPPAEAPSSDAEGLRAAQDSVIDSIAAMPADARVTAVRMFPRDIRDGQLLARAREREQVRPWEGTQAVIRAVEQANAEEDGTTQPDTEDLARMTDQELDQLRRDLIERIADIHDATSPETRERDRQLLRRLRDERNAILQEQTRRQEEADAETEARNPDPVDETPAETPNAGDRVRTADGVEGEVMRVQPGGVIFFMDDNGTTSTLQPGTYTRVDAIPPEPEAAPPEGPRNDASSWRRWGDRAQQIADSPGPTLEDLRTSTQRYRDGARIPTDEYNANIERIRVAFQEMYGPGDGSIGRNGATVEVATVSSYGASAGVTGFILKDGERIGNFTRSIKWDPYTGKPKEIHNDYFRINPEHQGQGIAEDLYRRQENWAIREGVPRITIHANIDVGGYAWASKGYDFRSRAQATRILGRMRQNTRWQTSGEHGDAFRAAQEQLDTWSNNMSSGGRAPTAYELSQLGRENAWTTDAGKQMWPGKALMLGTGWQAVKRLTPPRGASRGRAAGTTSADPATLRTANGRALRRGDEMMANGRRGTVISVRPSGIVIFRDESGTQRSTQIRRATALPEVLPANGTTTPDATAPRPDLAPEQLRSLPAATPAELLPGARIVTRLSATRGEVISLERGRRGSPHRIVNFRPDGEGQGSSRIAYVSNTIMEDVADRNAAPRTTAPAPPTPNVPTTPTQDDLNARVPEHMRLGQHVQIRGTGDHGTVTEVYEQRVRMGGSTLPRGRLVVRFTDQDGSRWDIPVDSGRLQPYTPPPPRSTWEPSRDAGNYAAWGARGAEIAQSNGPNMRQMAWDLQNARGTEAGYRTQIEQMYNGDRGLGSQGYKVRMRELSFRADPYGGGRSRMHIQGSLRDADGLEVGTVSRTVYFDGAGDPVEVHNDLFTIDRAYRGQGVASDLYRRQENWAIQQGVSKITIHANIDVGGYAWARAGYDYQNRDQADMHLRSLISRASDRSGPEYAAALEELRSFQQRMRDNPTWFPTPWELSRVGRTDAEGHDIIMTDRNGKPTWPGKELMLGTDWLAVKHLRPANPRDMSSTTGVVNADPIPAGPIAPTAEQLDEDRAQVQDQLNEMARENGLDRSGYTPETLVGMYEDDVRRDLREYPNDDVTIGVPSMSEITIPNRLVRDMLGMPLTASLVG